MVGSAARVVPVKRRIGGSDISKLLGLSKYGNARDVYDRIVLGLEEPGGPLAMRGQMFEPVLRAHAQNHLGVVIEVRDSDYHPHPSLEFAHAQVDDLAQWFGVDVCVDYKTVNRFAARHQGWGREGTDEVPEGLRAQIAWEMLCADRERSILVAAFGEDVKDERVFVIGHIGTYEIERCPQFESYLIGVAHEFWGRHVIPGVPPDVKPIGKNKVPIK